MDGPLEQLPAEHCDVAAVRAAETAAQWRFERAVARVKPVDRILADYATELCNRPVRRIDRPPGPSGDVPGVVWSIDDAVVVELLPSEHGPARLVVHDIAVLGLLRKQLRTRHVTVRHAGATLKDR